MAVAGPVHPADGRARVTEHVGLVATVSSSFQHPYNIARVVASLDQVSGGRAAWDVVATRSPQAAPLFGLDELAGHDDRGFAGAILDLARRDDLTVRQLLERNPNGHRSIVGTPEQVADDIEE